MLVSCIPVITLGFGAALTHLLKAGVTDDATPAGSTGQRGLLSAAQQDAAAGQTYAPRSRPYGLPASGSSGMPWTATYGSRAAVPVRTRCPGRWTVTRWSRRSRRRSATRSRLASAGIPITRRSWNAPAAAGPGVRRPYGMPA